MSENFAGESASSSHLPRWSSAVTRWFPCHRRRPRLEGRSQWPAVSVHPARKMTHIETTGVNEKLLIAGGNTGVYHYQKVGSRAEHFKPPNNSLKQIATYAGGCLY